MLKDVNPTDRMILHKFCCRKND